MEGIEEIMDKEKKKELESYNEKLREKKRRSRAKDIRRKDPQSS